ncbi:hypothetical protein [Stutzerimonas stutzeri]|uniref:hypothetical protein n=1 Tax=Stutzerimonas stutzeri TaxID=316 RepID=UPI00101ADA3C|nr:hypothetical protein [Stutzerimonas stutzeri]
MRLSDDTRYPHPVLSPFSDDYTKGEFEVSFAVSENLETGALTLRYDSIVEEPDIKELILSGQASLGCIVVSLETYYINLHKLSWDHGLIDFPAGFFLGDVSLRPIIWLDCDQLIFSSKNISFEFELPIALVKGDILAIGEETLINVGQAKLAPLESIFELVDSPDIPEGRVQIDLDRDRIAILLGTKSFAAINSLRGQEEKSPTLMSSVYLPVVMEILDSVRNNPGAYVDRRWYRPFSHKCTFKGVSLTPGASSLAGAQILLEDPISNIFDSRNGGSDEN